MLFDQKVFNLIYGFAGKSRFLDLLGIFFAEYSGYILAIIVVVLVFKAGGWKKRIHYFSLIALTTILSRGIITEFIRLVYPRLRPFKELAINALVNHSNESSFPSGHMAFYFALILPVFCINRRAGWYLSGVVFLMGLARIFVGVHWPMDIISGIAVACISFYVVHKYILKDPPCENCIFKK